MLTAVVVSQSVIFTGLRKEGKWDFLNTKCCCATCTLALALVPHVAFYMWQYKFCLDMI